MYVTLQKACTSFFFQVQARFDTFITTQRDMFNLWDKLSILDPRNLANRADNSWRTYASFFAPITMEGEDDDLETCKGQVTAHLQEEWAHYWQVWVPSGVLLHIFFCQVKNSGMESLSDVIQFWKQRDPHLQAAVLPYLWYPTTSAAIERSFSLTGVNR